MMDNLRKILFIHSSLRGGGAEKVLIDILSHFDKNKYQIDLLLLDHSGVYMQQIPKQVNLLDFQTKKYSRLITSFFVHTDIYGLILRKNLKNYFKNSHYDTIISFMEGLPAKCHSYILDKATRNISWIHTDMICNHYSKVLFPYPKQEKNFYSKVDEIVFVSKESKSKFQQLFGINKGTIIYNLIDRDSILHKASSFTPNKTKFTICTVGRLIPIKRQDRIIQIAKIIKDKGYDFEFWILGSGSLEAELKNKATELGVSENVSFIGFQENPYPYIKNADIFILTSDAEGLPLVICEAMCLGKPIISTDITGPTELIGNTNSGILTSFDVHQIANALTSLFDDQQKLKMYQDGSKNRGIELSDTNKTMQSIYRAIN